jgi:hypothetical protein
MIDLHRVEKIDSTRTDGSSRSPELSFELNATTRIMAMSYFLRTSSVMLFAWATLSLSSYGDESSIPTSFPVEEAVPPAGATYRIIPRPLPKHMGKHLPYSTTNQPTAPSQLDSIPTQPYAYGWFGPRPTPSWSRHFGYGRRYTQWSLK